MFFSRKNEIKSINELFKKSGTSVLLYGKRRVGKTELIKEVFKNKRKIYFECLKDTLETNLYLFIRECEKNGVIFPSYFSPRTFIDVFDFLNTLDERFYVAIDEYPYLKELNGSGSVDSMFQNIIDHHLKNINLIISGSSLRIMNDLLKEGNPLFGRFDLTINLKEFNYLEAAQFYPNLSFYDKASFFAIFGGSPFVNKEINPKLSLEDNIINTILKEGSEVYNYANSVLISDVTNELQARRLLSTIANSKKRHGELVSILDKEKTGILSRSLNSLQEVDLIKKVAPINHLNDSKKAFYEISDNVIRFFYTYVYQNKSQLNLLGPKAFYKEYIAKSITTFISYRFENLVREYFSLNVKKDMLKGIKNIGVYYYDDSINKTNGEFDVAIETSAGYEIYEAKFLRNKVKKAMIDKEAAQIKQISAITINKIGFVSISGFEDFKCKYQLISGEDLYK